MRKAVVAERKARSDRPKGGHLALVGGQSSGGDVPSESETVAVTALRKAYGANRAVDDVSFTVATGEIFALLGPNGAGKTTTIEILEGFRNRDAGQVRVLGVDPGDPRTQRRMRSRMGVVLQELAVEPFLSVREVLTRNAGFYPAPRPVDEVIDLVGLTNKADARVRRCRVASSADSTWGSASWATPSCSFSTSPPPDSTPAGGAWPGNSCADSPLRALR